MQPGDLVLFALANISSPHPSCVESSYRRAVSASYYALFHRLAESGAAAFSGAGAATSNQVRRAFKHGEMKQVCERYRSWAPGKQLAPPLHALQNGPLNMDLVKIAAAFVRLQELRETADYDLTRKLSLQEATEAFQLAQQALADFDAIEHDPATQTFLTALLMADRWKRGGG